jgi:hypothetical protein
LITTILQQHHDYPLSGHLAFRKTLARVRQYFIWPGIDVKLYCSECLKYQQYASYRQAKAPLKSIVTTAPWDLISIDVVGPLTRTTHGHYYIIAAIDHFSKYVIASTISNLTAITTTRFVFQEIICKYGTPERILTDQGRNFDCELFKNLCQLLQIDKLRTTAYHPAGIGERSSFAQIDTEQVY